MKTIGIVGGAGPMAGVALLQRIFTLCQKLHGCHRDGDFPKVILISYPFTEMLEGEIDGEQVQKELQTCLNDLRSQGASVLAIACNTLHLFLKEVPSDLIHLPREVEAAIQGEMALVLCTSTSARFRLHRQFFPCIYPDSVTQERVDMIIDAGLRGEDQTEQLRKLIRNCKERTIVLGCTELSLINDLNVPGKVIVDPLEIVATRLIETIKLGKKI